MWHTDTTDDYLTALQDLIDIATSDHVATVAIDGGGTGYVVGDVLSVAGGTSTHTATLLVTSVSSGVIDGIRVSNGGAYTADPTLSANAVTGGTGSGATMDLTMDGTGWTVDRREYRAARATVAAGGSGYSVGQILTISGGTFSEAARFRIQSVSSGAVVAVAPLLRGSNTFTHDFTGLYTATPSNSASTTVNTGGGSGCTLDVEYDQELIMEGSGAGSDDITVGIKTYQTTNTSGFNTCYNWALFAMPAYQSSENFFAQASLSPGFLTTPASDPDLAAGTGAYLPLRDADGSFPITYWFNITPRRIVAVFKVESPITTCYPSMYLGYLNGLGTSSELPFPMYVSGSSHRLNVWYQDTTPFISGLTVMDGGGGDNGPGFYYRAAFGTWAGADNSDAQEAGLSRLTSNDSRIYPGGGDNPKDQPPGFGFLSADGWGSWSDLIPDIGVPGTVIGELYPTPNSGGDIYWLVPATVIDQDDNENIWLPYGELSNVFFVPRGGTLTSEDTITIGNEQYRVFQNGNGTEEWSYMAIKETF